jgi:hypothetical protein
MKPELEAIGNWQLGVAWSLAVGRWKFGRPFLGRPFPRPNKTAVKSHEFPKLLCGTQLDIPSG